MSATLTWPWCNITAQSRIALNFDYNPDWHQHIKKVPGARWSKTMKSWHVPDTDENRIKCRLTSGLMLSQHITIISRPHPPATRGIMLPAVYVPAHTLLHHRNKGR